LHIFGTFDHVLVHSSCSSRCRLVQSSIVSSGYVVHGLSIQISFFTSTHRQCVMQHKYRNNGNFTQTLIYSRLSI
ncbi:hypothetical protein T4B_584, partial [Trichinella pseudospiralis]